MKKRIAALILVIVMVTGCAGTAGESGAHNEIIKYNAYVELINFIDGWFGLTIQSYFNTFGTDAEPSFGRDFERMFVGFDEVDFDMAELHGRVHREARRLAGEDPDWGEADARMLVLADAVETVMELYFVEMTEYYSSGAYEADNFQQGHNMHVRMIDYVIAMWDALDDFMHAFSPIIWARQGADLPLFEEHGLVIHAYLLRVVLTGMEISGRMDEPVSELGELIHTFALNILALEKANTEEQRNAEGFDPLAGSHIGLFITSAELVRDILLNAFTDGRSLHDTQFLFRLDSVIDRYNLIISL